MEGGNPVRNLILVLSNRRKIFSSYYPDITADRTPDLAATVAENRVGTWEANLLLASEKGGDWESLCKAYLGGNKCVIQKKNQVAQNLN